MLASKWGWRASITGKESAQDAQCAAARDAVAVRRPSPPKWRGSCALLLGKATLLSTQEVSKIFYSVVTSVVRFGAGHRKLYKSELRKLDVHCRKLLRQIVGPPRSIDWTKPCHSILDQWNQRVMEQMQLNGVEFWLNRCMPDSSKKSAVCRGLG